ncbi:MAG TPA: serine hydrolase domain-containing protein [Acidimicrobiales bacterium]|nr:serine hydrolase domain-containing protein [Acidimicrobiales bacterium]
MDIQGQCDDRFSAVADEFERNLRERGERGASFCATVGGETVVDLWGGEGWERDTTTVVMSSTKGATALAAHLLVSAGELDLDAPVATYWPEFAANGKEGVLVRHLLSHQAGLPALREPLPAGGFFDWGLVTSRLAAEAPFWEPGTRHGYHALTFGFLVGEVVRRVTGRSLGTFVAEEIAEPLGLDLQIGVADVAGIAPLVPPDMTTLTPDQVPPFYVQAMTDPTSIPALVLGNTGGYMDPGAWNEPDALRAEIPAAGGVANARALAGMYRAIVHDRKVGRYALTSGDVVRMASIQSAGSSDAVLGSPGRWTLGFFRAAATPRGVTPAAVVALSDDAFGHTGNGGSYGFADPGCDASFAYVMSQMSMAMGLSPTGQALADAFYSSLGYERAEHLWVRP